MKEKYISALKKQVEQVDNLANIRRFSPEFEGWRTKTASLLERIFGKESTHYSNFHAVRYSLGIYSAKTQDSRFQEAYRKGLYSAKAILNSIIEELEEFGIPEKMSNLEKETKGSSVTVNLNQKVQVNVKTILENNLTFSQYQGLKEILEIQDGKEKRNKLSEFLTALGLGVTVEMLKSILLGV